MTSSRGGLGEQPPPNPDVASLTTRWESRTQKISFFFLPCSSDSYCVHRTGSCRNQKIGNDKFERRPRRVPSPKSRRRQPHDEVGIVRTKRFVFQKKLAMSCLMTPHFVSNNLLGRGSQTVGKWSL
jgi:hypothetical protein